MRIALPMKIRRAIVVSIFTMALAVTSLAPITTPAVAAQNQPAGGQQTAQDQCKRGSFLAFPRWYDGLCENGKIKPISNTNATGAGSLGSMIWTIVLNIIAIMLYVVGYVSLGFIIWGGIKFVISGDNANGVASARKTILNAVIGLVISIMSTAIVNVIAGTF